MSNLVCPNTETSAFQSRKSPDSNVEILENLWTLDPIYQCDDWYCLNMMG